MINQLSNFASSLVASIIALTMIEMILPNNKTKKYVTFAATAVLSIVITNPIIFLLNKDVNLEKILDKNENDFSSSEYMAKMEYAKEKSIDEMYQAALKQDIINRLEDNGYRVKNISFSVDKKTYEPIKMELEIEHDDGDIQKVIIDASKNYQEEISLFEIAKVKDILYSTYNIDRKNIVINNR